MAVIKFITGKGGVGKTTVATALAREEAAQGKKCLLVEFEGSSGLEGLLGQVLGDQPTQCDPNLWAVRWEALSCLRELVGHFLRSERLTQMFFNSELMKDFLSSAPGLKELALLGKVTSSVRNFGPPMDFDLIVVDAFSTGHLLSLLDAPLAMGKAFQLGPMGTQSRSMVKAVENHSLVEFLVVGLSSALVIQESREFIDELKKRKLNVKFVHNKFMCVDDQESRAWAELSEPSPFLEYINSYISEQQKLEELIKADYYCDLALAHEVRLRHV